MGGIRTYILREGEDCEVLRDMGTTVDQLNNRAGNWQTTGTTRAIKYKTDDARLVETDTGSYEVDMARFALPADTIAESGDRIVYDGAAYELRSIDTRSSHAEADAKLIPN